MVASGLRLVTERSGDGAGEPILDSGDGEELMHVQPEVSIVFGNRPSEFPGTLYISSRQIIWLSDADRRKGYAVDFFSVSLHAVSRDLEAYPLPCIYAQLESGHEDDDSYGSDTESNGVLDLTKITEMRLVPSDHTQLDILFDVLCECAELNPEPIEGPEGEEEHSWIFSADQLEGEATGNEDADWISQNPGQSIGFSNGDHDLAHNVLQLQINDHRFEDAEEKNSDGSSGQR